MGIYEKEGLSTCQAMQNRGPYLLFLLRVKIVIRLVCGHRKVRATAKKIKRKNQLTTACIWRSHRHALYVIGKKASVYKEANAHNSVKFDTSLYWGNREWDPFLQGNQKGIRRMNPVFSLNPNFTLPWRILWAYCSIYFGGSSDTCVQRYWEIAHGTLEKKKMKKMLNHRDLEKAPLHKQTKTGELSTK